MLVIVGKVAGELKGLKRRRTETVTCGCETLGVAKSFFYCICKQFAKDLQGNGYKNLSLNIFIITEKLHLVQYALRVALKR